MPLILERLYALDPNWDPLEAELGRVDRLSTVDVSSAAFVGFALDSCAFKTPSTAARRRVRFSLWVLSEVTLALFLPCCWRRTARRYLRVGI